jgi:hypothetical protein
MKSLSVLVSLSSLTLRFVGAEEAAVLPHDAAEHAKQCAAGVNVDCVVDSSWSVPPNYGYNGACSTTCGQGVTTRTARTVIHGACNAGKPCPALTETVECMEKVCACEIVRCKYENHTCTDYSNDNWNGLLYHSVDSWVHDTHGRVVDYYADKNGGSYDRRNRPHVDTNAQVLHDGEYGAGSADGDAITVDYHNETSRCGVHESVRVYHKRGEDAALGHHCRITAKAAVPANHVCECRCDPLNPPPFFAHTNARPSLKVQLALPGYVQPARFEQVRPQNQPVGRRADARSNLLPHPGAHTESEQIPHAVPDAVPDSIPYAVPDSISDAVPDAVPDDRVSPRPVRSRRRWRLSGLRARLDQHRIQRAGVQRVPERQVRCRD